jgi:hypothetical protein
MALLDILLAVPIDVVEITLHKGIEHVRRKVLDKLPIQIWLLTPLIVRLPHDVMER